MKKRNVFHVCMKIFFYPLIFFLSTDEKKIKVFLDKLFSLIEIASHHQILYRYTKEKSADLKQDPHHKILDTVIVVQGPIREKDRFSYDLLRRYRHLYPDTPIVLSSWKKDESAYLKECCKSLNVDFVGNDYPLFSGYGHVNYQLVSTICGVKFAINKYHPKYILKTRTDQVLLHYDFLNYMKISLSLIPPMGHKLEKRIIMLGELDNSYYWLPFCVSDFLAFGAAKDIENLYGIDNQSFEEAQEMKRHSRLRNDLRAKSNKFELLRDEGKDECNRLRDTYQRVMFTPINPEMYILMKFHEKIIGPLNKEHLIEQYHDFLAKYLFIMDSSQLMMHWPKYEQFSYEYRNFCSGTGKLDHSSWLDLYMKREEQ